MTFKKRIDTSVDLFIIIDKSNTEIKTPDESRILKIKVTKYDKLSGKIEAISEINPGILITIDENIDKFFHSKHDALLYLMHLNNNPKINTEEIKETVDAMKDVLKAFADSLTKATKEVLNYPDLSGFLKNMNKSDREFVEKIIKGNTK